MLVHSLGHARDQGILHFLQFSSIILVAWYHQIASFILTVLHTPIQSTLELPYFLIPRVSIRNFVEQNTTATHSDDKAVGDSAIRIYLPAVRSYALVGEAFGIAVRIVPRPRMNPSFLPYRSSQPRIWRNFAPRCGRPSCLFRPTLHVPRLPFLS